MEFSVYGIIIIFLKSAQRHALKYHDTGLLLKNTYIPTPPQKYIINTVFYIYIYI